MRADAGPDAAPDHAGLLPAGEEAVEDGLDPLVETVVPLGGIARKDVLQPAVGRHQAERPGEEGDQSLPRVVGRGGLLGDADGLVDLLLQIRPGQLVLVREVPVGGRDVDAGLGRDLRAILSAWYMHLPPYLRAYSAEGPLRDFPSPLAEFMKAFQEGSLEEQKMAQCLRLPGTL